MDGFLALSELWAKHGGLSGVVILTLLALVVFLVLQLMKVNNRLIDFKAAVYEAGLLPDRRGRKRKSKEESK